MSGINACREANTNYLLVGTYTDSGSEGIYVFTFDKNTGNVQPVSNTESIINPSFLSADGQYVYAVNETGRDKPGSLSSFSFDQQTGRLTFLNRETTGGDDPCYVALSPEKKWAVTANYSGGSLTAFPIRDDGTLKPYAQLIQHEGSGPNKDRQSAPHVHSVVFSPDGHFILTADLGLDKIFVYRFDPVASAPMQLKEVFDLPPGSGPRHIAFSPDGKYAYVVRELDGMITALTYNDGNLKFLQEVPSHPRGNRVEMNGAEVKISPDGRFLYTSNRGEENAIAIFAINESGELNHIGYQKVFGLTPRNFLIDPSGKYLIVANQESDNIILFERNQETGLLKKKEGEIVVPKPVYLLIPES